jgi:hypothetical protein
MLSDAFLTDGNYAFMTNAMDISLQLFIFMPLTITIPKNVPYAAITIRNITCVPKLCGPTIAEPA